MFRHLLKLTWKRKTRNLMLSLEILLAFAIVFAIAAYGIRNYQLYRMPLGFEATDVWSVSLQTGDDGKARIDAATYDALSRGVRELPEVVQVSFASHPPFTMSTHTTSMHGAAGQLETHVFEGDDNLAQVLGLDLVEGRWFSPLDDGSAARPVVVNRAMAQALFPGQPALGRQFTDSERDQKWTYKVVGVLSEFRDKGELMEPVKFTLQRFIPGSGSRDARTMILKVKPGTDRGFETRLNRRLKLIRNDWTFQISTLPTLRKSMLNTRSMPLIVLGVIAAFMLLMVAFGLFGALWQNTTQRIPEIGLRRALGARAGDIYRQIMAEQLLLSSSAIVVALLLLAQLPLTGALGESLNWTVFLSAAGLSMFVIYLISLLCSLYPGWRASRLSPTEALHYE
jgi:putative ABC transport system permease protein